MKSLWVMWMEMQFWKSICNNVYLTGFHEDCSELLPFEALQLLFMSRDDGWMLELGKKISNHCIRKRWECGQISPYLSFPTSLSWLSLIHTNNYILLNISTISNKARNTIKISWKMEKFRCSVNKSSIIMKYLFYYFAYLFITHLFLKGIEVATLGYVDDSFI